MHRNEIITALQISRGMTIAYVQFYSSETTVEQLRQNVTRRQGPTPGGKHYAYKVPPNMTLAEGDIVVAQTYDHLSLGVVKNVTQNMPRDYDFTKALRYVVTKVDTTDAERLEREERSIADQFARAEIKSKLQEYERATGFSLASLSTPTLDALLPPQAVPPHPGPTVETGSMQYPYRHYSAHTTYEGETHVGVIPDEAPKAGLSDVRDYADLYDLPPEY